MKTTFIAFTALKFLATSHADCSQYQFTRQLDPFLTLDYVVDVSNGPGTFRGRLTYNGVAWVGFGHSLQDEGMVPGQSVIGSTAGIFKYRHTSRSEAGVTPTLEQTLSDTSFEQSTTQTVLEFTKLLNENGELPITIGLNNFIYAYGFGNELTFHDGHGVAQFEIEPCFSNETGVVQTPSAQELPGTTAPSLPTTTTPTNAPTEPPLAEFPDPSIDCSGSATQFRQLTSELFFEWSLNRDNRILSGRAILEREAWLAIGVTASAAGSMFPSNAIIGMPEVGFPRKYSIDGRSVNLINLLPDDRQTLSNSTLEQRNGQTIMTFQKILDEPDEVLLDADGLNTLIFAYGTSNDFGRHTSSDRGSFKIFLDPCFDSGEVPELLLDNNYRDMWTTHGAFAGIAWGILTPLAIASSMLRDYFPPGGVWFTVHLVLNLTTFMFTTIAFSFAVIATQKSTLEGESPNHFAGLAHRTVGLFIMVLTLAQVVAGMLRPHAPQKAEEKERIRFVWEVLHKLVGFGLVVAAWWQCQSGLTLYAEQFGTKDYTSMFLGVVVTIAIATFILWSYKRFNKE